MSLELGTGLYVKWWQYPVYIHKQVNYRLDNCTTLWGEHELVHVQNVEQLNAHVCNQNTTQHCPSSGRGIYHAYTRVQHRNCELGIPEAVGQDRKHSHFT